MKPRIIVKHRGRLGNKMFQAMLAFALKQKVPEARISGLNLPEWGIISPPEQLPRQHKLVLRGQRLNLDEIAWMLNKRVIPQVELDVWAQRLSYYDSPEFYNQLFSPKTEGQLIEDDQILINIRAEDILTGWHSKYYPLPFSYYDHILEKTGLRPVFMGQIDDSSYCTSLRNRYRDGIFLPSQSILEDFETLRNARSVVLSISTFSWLATWISSRTRSIFMPVAGAFDPLVSNSLLLPFNDIRYQFIRVSIPTKAEREGLNVVEWANHPRIHNRYTKKELQHLLIRAESVRTKKPRNTSSATIAGSTDKSTMR